MGAIKTYSEYLKESTWGDMVKRAEGDEIRKEDDIDFIEVCGKNIPMDYYSLYIQDKQYFEKTVSEHYNPNPARNYISFKNWLSKYKGDLPKTVDALAEKFGFEKDIVDLFVTNKDGMFDEDDYRKHHSKAIKSFFENLPTLKEKRNRFYSADAGGRNIVQYMQDVLVGNIFERMIVHHSKLKNAKINGVEIFKINQEASNLDVVNTKPDLIYEFTRDKETIRLSVEIKTRFKSDIEDKDLEIKMRGNANEVKKDKGMVVTFFLNTNGIQTCVLDPATHNSYTKNIYGKQYEIFPVDDSDFLSCVFWEETYMIELLNKIYKLYKKRNKK